jgi:hypothetical protein
MGKELSGSGWSGTPTKDGIRRITCESWSGYVSFLNDKLLDYRSYVFRGHASEAWKLESTLDRALKDVPKKLRSEKREQHLENFKYASRGRRGPTPPVVNDENEWWALGQHHALATPLLDWTESPYVAAYFAFHSPSHVDSTKNRVVVALSRSSVTRKCSALRNEAKKTDTACDDLITFVRPMSDENQRLITQRGLFTRAPDGESIESWVKRTFAGDSDGAKLLRISIPNSDRVTAMKSLNRMNINHLSLFPDVYGAAKHCNNDLLIEKY